jgi:hypothetical protein
VIITVGTSRYVCESNCIELRFDDMCTTGWSDFYDEWISIRSDRVAPHQTRARGGKSSGGVWTVICTPVVFLDALDVVL